MFSSSFPKTRTKLDSKWLGTQQQQPPNMVLCFYLHSQLVTAMEDEGEKKAGGGVANP